MDAFYLNEFFIDKTKQIPIELDLICSFNYDGTFTAIFGVHNQHSFELPVKVNPLIFVKSYAIPLNMILYILFPFLIWEQVSITN